MCDVRNIHVRNNVVGERMPEVVKLDVGNRHVTSRVLLSQAANRTSAAGCLMSNVSMSEAAMSPMPMSLVASRKSPSHKSDVVNT